MLVFHGVNDTLVPMAVARHFVAQLRLHSPAPVASVELPWAQHAFDVLASIRSRHTTMGAVRFLEAMRVRADRRAPAPDGAVPGDRSTCLIPAGRGCGARHAVEFLT